MSLSLSMTRDALAYRGPQLEGAGQRAAALAAAVGLHLAFIGAFVLIGLRQAPSPPEKVITVSFITETPAAVAPTPPQPAQATPPPPERQMIATARPTESTITAPPVETPTAQVTPTPAPPSPAPPPPATAAAVAAATPGPITPPDFRAGYLNNPAPIYPASSRRKREEGVVRLRVQVSTEGSPVQVNVDRTSGSPELDAAAQDVVRKRWKFVAAKQAGVPITAWVIVPLEFSLKR